MYRPLAAAPPSVLGSRRRDRADLGTVTERDRHSLALTYPGLEPQEELTLPLSVKCRVPHAPACCSGRLGLKLTER